MFTAYLILCAFAALQNHNNGWSFWNAFTLSVFMTPLAGFTLAALRGRNVEELKYRSAFMKRAKEEAEARKARKEQKGKAI